MQLPVRIHYSTDTLEDLLERLFRPLEYLDLSHLYATYASVIDFFVFLLIFVGAARATVGRKFPGRAGAAMSAGVGIALALGMLYAERTWRFNLRSFGSVAVIILILLLGVMVFRLLHLAGISSLAALSLAYLAILFLFSSVAPSFLSWLDDSVPFSNAAAILLFLLALVGLLGGFGRGTHKRYIDTQVRRTRTVSPERLRDRQILIEDRWPKSIA
jgi:hypothetical protein